MTSRHFAWLLLVSAIMACNARKKDAAQPGGGTIVIATTVDPDALFPPSALNMSARQGTELIFEYLADVGPGMNTIGDSGFVKELASSWTWSADSTSISFQLNPRARWQDGRKVSSRDVAFTFRVYTDTLVARNGISELSDIDSVTTRDSSTATFWFRQRTSHQFYDAASLMLILPEHVYGAVPRDSLREFAAATTPIGSGRYHLVRWTKGSGFELGAVKNHYRGDASIQRLIWTVSPEYNSGVLQLLSGSADIFENVRLETVSELKKNGNYKVTSTPGMDYVFMRFNLRDPSRPSAPHPIFQSRELRRALTMLIDRQSLVKNLFDSLANVSIGPTVRAFPSTDTSVVPIAFDPPAARRILDSLGWKRPAADENRMRNGKALRFTAMVPVSSLSRMRIAVMMQEQLRREGVDMQIEQMDLNAFNAREASWDFDAAFGAWHLGSLPGGVRDTWTTAAAGKGGLNYGHYSNYRFDSLVDSALSSPTVDRARANFRKAHQLIVDDAPAVWLYEPRTLIAVHRRIRTTPMRPSAWWVQIGSWQIPASERLGRDVVAAPKNR